MKAHSIPEGELALLLKPAAPGETPAYEVELGRVFREVLARANDFVPSQAGVIFLEDAAVEDAAAEGDALDDTAHAGLDSEVIGPDSEPGLGDDDNERTEPALVAVASFGPDAERILEGRLPLATGIAGRVHAFGEAEVGAWAAGERLPEWHELGGELAIHSVIAVPLHLGREVVGVLELMNQESDAERELELLEIFAQTLSAALVNAVEAQRSREMARRDDLTHLFNDRHLHHCLTVTLEESLRGAEDCGLIFFDLDHFKNVNDTHGHLAGSQVLREIGELLRRVLPGAAIAARYGGDEFVVILPEAARQEVFWVAETIRKSIEKHVFLDHQENDGPSGCSGLAIRGLTASVGWATLRSDTLLAFEDNGSGAADVHAVKNEFLRRADRRMYRAKEMGRNLTVSAREEGRERRPSTVEPRSGGPAQAASATVSPRNAE